MLGAATGTGGEDDAGAGAGDDDGLGGTPDVITDEPSLVQDEQIYCPAADLLLRRGHRDDLGAVGEGDGAFSLVRDRRAEEGGGGGVGDFREHPLRRVLGGGDD